MWKNCRRFLYLFKNQIIFLKISSEFNNTYYDYIYKTYIIKLLISLKKKQ